MVNQQAQKGHMILDGVEFPESWTRRDENILWHLLEIEIESSTLTRPPHVWMIVELSMASIPRAQLCGTDVRMNTIAGTPPEYPEEITRLLKLEGASDEGKQGQRTFSVAPQ